MHRNIANIVCIGDSTTSQEWCHPNWVDWMNFVFKQGEHSESYNIINAGIDGGIVDMYLDNFDQYIARYQPKIVIMSLGFNQLEGISQFSQQSEILIKRIKELGCDVILWSTYETVNPIYSDKLAEVSRLYSEIAEKHQCTFVNIYDEFKKYDLTKIFTYKHKWENAHWNLKPGDIDFLHCNEIGNQIIAEAILKQAFDLDLSLADEFGDFGSMQRADLSEFLMNK